MSARRTKKSKLKSAQRRQIPQVNQAVTTNKAEVEDLLHYDTSLIVKDLGRTVIATVVVFGILVALYYQL